MMNIWRYTTAVLLLAAGAALYGNVVVSKLIDAVAEMVPAILVAIHVVAVIVVILVLVVMKKYRGARIQTLMKMERKQPEEFGRSTKHEVEVSDESFDASDDNLHDVPGQADTYSGLRPRCSSDTISQDPFEKVWKPCSCRCPGTSTSQDPFHRAWKAVESGETSKLEQAIQEMKESEDGSSALLDTYRLMEKSGVTYSMSLLALSGFHGRKDMVDLLLKEGADMNPKCSCERHTGTPVCQMMLHCLIEDDYEKLSSTMLQYFIQKGAKLSERVTIRHVSLFRSYYGGFDYGMLDLPLSMQRIDCAKILIEEGVDLINGGSPEGEEFAVVPMFQEYRDHGTNDFIRWAFNQYIPQHPEIDLKKFTERVIQACINMNKKDEQRFFWRSIRRAPAHAILTSHHEATVERLVQCGKDFGLNLLTDRSRTGKTALHVAAEDNDVKSVHILLQLGADTRACDNSEMNPFMIAVAKNHLEVVKAMIKKEPDLVSMPVGSGSTVVHWALEEGHHRSAFFKFFIKENPDVLLTTKDSQGNTIAHLVAASGNTKVFKILWSKEFSDEVFNNQNSEGKTPLQLAVEKGHVNILKTFKACVDEGRKPTAPLWQHRLKTEWWSKIVPHIIFASSSGSLGAVKYYIDSGQEPNISHNDKTPLLCAAEAGQDEIVAYLLQFRKVRTDLRKQPGEVESASESPLLIAAQNGHTECVTLLLQNGANVLQRDSKKRTCLTVAIENHHKDTALAILSEMDGLKSLEKDNNPILLQLLIKEMPDLAEYVLNKCITQAGEDQPVKYNFDCLEDQIPNDQHDNHTLLLMIEHEPSLLQHPLVENFFFQKFWVMTFPLFLFNLLFYLILLATLNLFVVVVPRPGSQNETCQGQAVLAIAAIILCILSFIGFLVEVMQFINRGWRYFKDLDNYLLLALYTSTVIFIVSFDNDNWVSTPLQWQIGAFAVFFSWLNLIFILKYMPYTAVPINMFLSICARFLKLIYLPILLVLAFGVPYHMVFVDKTTFPEDLGSLTAFKSLIVAIAKILFQLVGEFDFEDTFKQGAFLYSPTTYILLITSLITMPILFTNLLNALAIGETKEIIEKAELTTHKLWVELILGRGWMKGVYMTRPCKTKYSLSSQSSPSNDLPYSDDDPGHWSNNHYVLKFFAKKYIQFTNFLLKMFGKEYIYHASIAKELKKKNEDIYSQVMTQNPVREDITDLKEDISNLTQELMLLHKQSEENLPGCHEVAVQTHAESTAMIAGYLRGLDVTGETSILVTNQAQTFHWAGYGLKLHIPQGALPAGLKVCRFLMKVGLSGQFKLPENTSLVSAVYWLDSDPRCKFSQPITLEMQHCVKPTHTSNLSFVHAKCSQEHLPYAFKTVEGGVFSSESAYGSVVLHHFSLFGQVKDMMLPGGLLYCASLYYLKKGVNQREIHFVITRNLEAHTTWVQQKYVDRGATVGPDLQVEFESDRISLQGVPFEDGWKIFSLNPQTITKKEVDSFSPGRRIPSCQLKAQWTKKSKPSQFTHKVTLEGAKEPSNYFCIDLDCDSTTLGGNKQPKLMPGHDLHNKYAAGLDSEPDLSDLLNEIAAEIPSKWRDMGQQLGLDHGLLEGIALISPGDTNHCYSNVFTRWKNKNLTTHPYTWSTVVQALKTPAVGEDRLANRIKNKLAGHSTQ